MSNFRGWIACASLAALAATAACSDREPVAATPSIVATPDRVTIGGALDVTLQFHVPPAGTLPPDGRVLLRLLFDNGEVMQMYDHQPPEPTQTWTAGKTIQYTQRVVLPDLPYVGDAYFAVGVAVGPHGRWLRLDAPKDSEVSTRLYKLAKIVITNR